MSYERVNWRDGTDSKTTPINAANLNTMDRGIKDLDEYADSLSERIDENVNGMVQLRNDISAVDNRVDTTNGLLNNNSAFNTSAKSMTGAVNEVKSKADTNATNIASVTTQANTNKTNIASLSDTVSKHGTRITNAENTIKSHTTSIGTLDTRSSNNATSISSLSTTVAGHTTSINSLSSNKADKTALDKKADKTALGTQVTFSLSGSTLTITSK